MSTIQDSVWSPAVILRARVIGIRWSATGERPTSLRRRVLKLRKLGALRSVASEVWGQ